MKKIRSCLSSAILFVLIAGGLFSSTNGYANDPIKKYLKQSIPTAWSNDSLFEAQLPIEDQWWQTFEDATLDSLMSIAFENSNNVLIAAKRITAAKAQMRGAYGGLFPQIELNGGWQRERVSKSTNPVSPLFEAGYAANLSATWELDIFGQIWQKARAQGSLYNASKAEYYGVMVSLASNLASAYFNLRSYQELLAVTQSNITSQESILKITQVRYDTGLASELDVAQAKSIYYNTKSQLNPILAAIDSYINSIAVLLGVYPSQIRASLSSVASYPQVVHLIPVNLPAGIITQRPDIISSLNQVQAEAALLGASRADWFPTFLLTGSIGFSAPEMKHLFEKNSQTWQIAPAMKWTIFSGGQRREAYVAQRAALDEAILQFNQNVLTAFQDVETAMSSYKNSVKEINDLNTVVNQGKVTLNLSLELYKEGLSQFQDVLSSQQSLLSYESSLVNAKNKTLQSLIQLYQSLGGGWVENPKIKMKY